MNLLPQQRKSVRNGLSSSTSCSTTVEIRKAAAVAAGYAEGSGNWLRERLSEEIIERSKHVMATHAVKAVNRIVATIDDDGSEPRAEVRLRAAEALLNRVGFGKQETINHNVQAVHGVVLLPPKKDIQINE